ncbi:uncharacterized protein LOC143259621 isoform X7 [Megalopta genalis]|uniref:uncharacterized protein LOC143259621 isoform X7 n=1 Tax=Megalopta genalis TaxID=115081 RepID=UPI003FD0A67F
MDTFRKNCAVYYSMLYYAGLWPYDHSIRAKVQRVAFIVLIISCIVCQILTLRNVEITLRNIVSMLSYTFLMLVYFFRYCGFIANFDLLKSFIEDIQNDFAILKNAAEIEIFKKQIRKSNRLTFLVLGYAIIVLLMYILFILIPTLLQSKYQVHYLRFIGYFYNERSRESDLVCVQIVVTGSLGILAIASTEATLGIYGFYLSALFQIVSYRIRKSVDDAATLITSSFVDIRPAVMMHQRAIKLTRRICRNRYDDFFFSGTSYSCLVVRSRFISHDELVSLIFHCSLFGLVEHSGSNGARSSYHAIVHLYIPRASIE